MIVEIKKTDTDFDVDEFIGIQLNQKQFDIDIIMPCGSQLKLNLNKQLFPSCDVPCGCGDSKHWFIKYGDN